jgi:hypothetical protein
VCLLGRVSLGRFNVGDWCISDFVTPLKKRRLARESVDTPQISSPSTSSPIVNPLVSQSGDSEAQPSDIPEEVKAFSPISNTPKVRPIL